MGELLDKWDESPESPWFCVGFAIGYPVIVALSLWSGSDDIMGFVAIVSGFALLPIVWIGCVGGCIAAAARFLFARDPAQEGDG